jgi:hypothetical protein
LTEAAVNERALDQHGGNPSALEAPHKSTSVLPLGGRGKKVVRCPPEMFGALTPFIQEEPCVIDDLLPLPIRHPKWPGDLEPSEGRGIDGGNLTLHESNGGSLALVGRTGASVRRARACMVAELRNCGTVLLKYLIRKVFSDSARMCCSGVRCGTELFHRVRGSTGSA